jgi:acyl-CoA synthetase (AMP-forming)/AMP-acid ligase II
MVDLECSGLFPLLADRESEPGVFAPSGELLWTRARLRAQAAEMAAALAAPSRRLVFLLCHNTPEMVAAFLGALAAGHAVTLLDAETPGSTLDLLTKTFAPGLVIAGPDRELSEAGGWSKRTLGDARILAASRGEPEAPLAPQLAVLLSTSGTTGSLKFVRLSAANLVANADQIISALGMTSDDIGVAHLPMHYSYGLSVVTSHLRVGGAIHLWPDSVTVPEFWSSLARSGATQFPGVPYHYNFLARGDLATLLPPRLRCFTQAGGALAPRLQTRMREGLGRIGGRFFAMYGQTEAAPRMTTLPHDRLPEKLGSVGRALPGGRITILADDGRPAAPGEVGSVVYEGPNVMLGYAQTVSDLALGDMMDGRLETGDLGRLDAEGFLVLTGRAKRFAKLHGLRLGLEEVEARFAAVAEIAAVDKGDKILLFTPTPEPVKTLLPTVAAEYKILSANLAVREVASLPRKSSGKIDYAALESMA